MAREYGWSARYVEGELTDELLVLYLDEAVDRTSSGAQARFDAMVEAVRVGTIFAHDGTQHARWVAGRRPPSRGLSGEALEQAVMRIAGMFPGNVERVSA